MVNLILKTKPVRVAFNMLCCAILLAWAGVKPRETISGLIGRKVLTSSETKAGKRWRRAKHIIDGLHFREPDHCVETAIAEARAREALGYPE